MSQFSLKLAVTAIAVFIAMIALSGCGILPFPFGTAPTRTPLPPPPTPLATETASAPIPTLSPVATNATAAANLRVTLERLLVEHVVLLTSLSASSFDGRVDEFKAISTTLDSNSVDLSKALGEIYGSDVEKNFLASWRQHIGFLIDYNAAILAKNKTKQDKATSNLNDYAGTLATMLGAANPKLSKDSLADLVKTQITMIKDVTDAQSGKDWVKTYANIRKAVAQTDSIATALANGAVAQFPTKYDGRADASGATLRASLTALLTEHVYLTSTATRAAFASRDAEFKAASDSLDANSVDLSKALGSAYGSDVEKNFLAGWRKHVGLVIDYAQGIIAKDKNKQDKATNDLNTYANDLASFLETTTNKNLSASTVGPLAKAHVASLKDIVDGHAAKDYTKAYNTLHSAFLQMSTIADPLADAIVKQFPDKYR
jgi:hypothetical protein